MSDLHKALYSRLSTYAGLTALVSIRIYPVVAPQDVTNPYVTYQAISTKRESCMGSDTGDVAARVQISAWSASYEEARSVIDQVRLALQRWSGTEASVTIKASFIETDNDLYEPDTRLFQIPMDVMIHHAE